MNAALGIMCKAPHPGRTKTRLAAFLGPERAAHLSACFLQDVANAVLAVPDALERQGYGVYAPAGTDVELAKILPATFRLLLQEGAEFGLVLGTAVQRLLGEAGHDCVVLINSDSPTLPVALLTTAITALRRPGDRVVLGPAIDGGYTLIGLKRDHPELFADIPWSTGDVLRLTLERAAGIALPVEMLPVWYDIDDVEALRILQAEIAGTPPAFASPGISGGPAPATRAMLALWPEV
ncbi:TIGR04282 family arsenosugar biosynthesis glycosyltransferase [Methylobacterium sp. PvR107]|uniref:TIGR04282 family arsenosugar biosynthesis glycosyltransferase n=1 Tax=Methylobacterium sp. PvR107 TaxID=2806597 RepID=UPI001AE15CC1|nr:TIGR04282 family arsenosugar biosynthesis glycosyltransferase [Methylobacterium sp. PvR107]MBP1179405.1 rSAM/selenodomain-associated transferase 1 [Methylobacterium sp. PvR107]